jgi:hypothetical protein
LDHGIGRALVDIEKLGIFPTEIGLDLLVLAAHVHAADTRISRATESQDTWTREIRLVVPVSELQRWVQTEPLLERMLNFLTGDRWKIGFRLRPARFQTFVKEPPATRTSIRYNDVGLFSGGLDSLIGAIDVLEQGRTSLLVSHAGEGATGKSQNDLFNSLKQHYRTQAFDRLRLWMSFPTGLVRRVDAEKTTRGRSFLFLALGIFAGTGLTNEFSLRVPENGLIALNVPLDPLRLGALSTRTTHPFYIARWNELLGKLGISGTVANPYWAKTKGEMVAECHNHSLLKRLCADSMSCSSSTKGRWKGVSEEHCGFCLPCLIRRAALKKGMRGTDPTTYTVRDLAAGVLDSRRAEGQQVRSFQVAIQRLRNRPELAKLLIHKPGPLSDESAANQAALAEVYRRGMDEVGTLLANVQTRPD